jgi:hypothetical protein
MSVEDGRVRRKPPKPALTQEEQARVDALRRARKVRKKGSVQKAAGPKTPESKRQAQQARSEARLARSGARLARMEQERAQLERERALVAASTQTHLTRLREGDSACSPWDDEFVQELLDLLDQGLKDRAVAIALAVTTELVSWHLPDDTLTRRYSNSPGGRLENGSWVHSICPRPGTPRAPALGNWRETEGSGSTGGRTASARERRGTRETASGRNIASSRCREALLVGACVCPLPSIRRGALVDGRNARRANPRIDGSARLRGGVTQLAHATTRRCSRTAR